MRLALTFLLLAGCSRPALTMAPCAAFDRCQVDGGSQDGLKQTGDATDPGSDGARIQGPSQPGEGPGQGGATGSEGWAVAFQIDTAHTGGQPKCQLRPPLTRRWAVSLASGGYSYPLIVDKMVFVVALISKRNVLYALSATTGDTLWGPVDLGTAAAGCAANPAWDSGTVFTLTGEGTVSAFDASNGVRLWSRSVRPWARETGDPLFVGPPIATDGRVYAAAGGTLVVFDGATGTFLWAGGDAGSPTSPAYTPGKLVLESISGGISAMDPQTGSVIWQRAPGGVGAGGDIPVIYRNQIYARDFWEDPNGVYDLETGQLIRTFAASTIPAFENDYGFFLIDGTLEAVDLTGSRLWRFGGERGEKPQTVPLAAGGIIYIGGRAFTASNGLGGKLWALDEKNGSLLWTESLESPIAPADETSGQGPVVGLAASTDLLVVPAGNVLAGYGQ